MFPPGGPDLPALQFMVVNGHEECENDLPSFFNRLEADMVVEQVSNGCVCVGGGGGGGVWCECVLV